MSLCLCFAISQYCQVEFDVRSTICGASNINYLLEKSRVVYQQQGERNYHIFSQMVKGIDPQTRSRLKLRTQRDYYYLNQSNCFEVDDQDDEADFGVVLSAMQQLNFSNTEIDCILTICAAILHLGNIAFVSSGDRKCTIQNKSVLNDVSQLIQVSPQMLEQVTTTRRMVVQGQAPIMIGLSDVEARAARDALSKFIYEKLFDWLVERINHSIGRGSSTQKLRSIGILDIFGFEIFQNNSFEQLCINYCNEKLQQFFNLYTFKKEEMLYQSEKIQYQHVQYIDK